MRKFLISAAIAATALAAAPAAAQYGGYYPQPGYGYGQPYGNPYGAPYGNAYGYNNYGQIRSLDARISQLQRQIQRLDQRNLLSNREAARLRAQAWDVRNDLRRAARDGLNYNEANRFQQRIAQLDFRIQREARDWNNRWGNRYGNRNWSDRDHDGRDDRWERRRDDRNDRDYDDYDD